MTKRQKARPPGNAESYFNRQCSHHSCLSSLLSSEVLEALQGGMQIARPIKCFVTTFRGVEKKEGRGIQHCTVRRLVFLKPRLNVFVSLTT